MRYDPNETDRLYYAYKAIAEKFIPAPLLKLPYATRIHLRDLLDAISTVRRISRKEISGDEIGEALCALSDMYGIVDLDPAFVRAGGWEPNILMRTLRSWLLQRGGELTAFHARGEARPHVLLTEIQDKITWALARAIAVFRSLPDYSATQQWMLDQMNEAKEKKPYGAEIYRTMERAEYLYRLFDIRARGFLTLVSKAPSVLTRNAFIVVVLDCKLVAWEQYIGFPPGDPDKGSSCFSLLLDGIVSDYTDAVNRCLEPPSGAAVGTPAHSATPQEGAVAEWQTGIAEGAELQEMRTLLQQFEPMEADAQHPRTVRTQAPTPNRPADGEPSRAWRTRAKGKPLCRNVLKELRSLARSMRVKDIIEQIKTRTGVVISERTYYSAKAGKPVSGATSTAIENGLKP